MKRTYSLLLFILMTSQLSFASYKRADAKKEIDSLLRFNSQLLFQSQFDSALTVANKIHDLSLKTNNSTGKSRSMIQLAIILIQTENFDTALEYLLEARKEKHYKESALSRLLVHENLGYIYMYQGLYDIATEEFHKALANSKEVPKSLQSINVTSLVYRFLIELNYKTQHQDSVYYYLNLNSKYLENADEAISHSNLINLHNQYANYYLLKDSIEMAQNHLNKAFRIAHQFHYSYLSRLYRCESKLAEKNKDYTTAIQQINKAIDNAAEKKRSDELPDLYADLCRLYQLDNQAEKSTECIRKQLSASNDSYNKKIELSYKILAQMRKFEKSERKAERAKNINFLIIILLSLIIVGSYFAYKRNCRRKVREKEIVLEKKTQEISDIRSRFEINNDELLQLASTNSPIFLTRFSEIHKDLYELLTLMHPKLTNSDLRLCAMIYLNIPTKQIATYTFIEHRSVQSKKLRLRKKLDVHPEIGLYHYLMGLKS